MNISEFDLAKLDDSLENVSLSHITGWFLIDDREDCSCSIVCLRRTGNISHFKADVDEDKEHEIGAEEYVFNRAIKEFKRVLDS